MKLPFLKTVKILPTLLLLAISVNSFAQRAFPIPAKPEKIYPINDYADVFTPEQEQALNDKLITYSDSTSNEIVVATVPTMDGDDINLVAAKWGELWQLGQKGKNNGVLVLISPDDRKMSIQAGRGTEDLLTDYQSKMIIEQVFKPYLKQGDYYSATHAGTSAIQSVLAGKFKNDTPTQPSSDGFGFTGLICVLFVIFIIILIANRRRNKDDDDGDIFMDRRGSHHGGGWIFPSGGGFGGGGGGGGGGFGGFGGGGSFGGGGASGDW